jgi:hypothetical protein
MNTNTTIPTRLFEELVAAVRAADNLGSCCLHSSTHDAPAFQSMRRFTAQAMHSLRQLDSMKVHGPTWKHDCDKCQYITSTFAPDGGRNDWYYCDQVGLGDTVVCRRSEKHSDYSSYPAIIIKSVADCTAEDSCGRKALVPELMIAKAVYELWQNRQSAKQIAEAMGREHAD